MNEVEKIKEKWQKKAITTKSEILRLQARLAQIENYIQTGRFPKQNGKKAKTIPKETKKEDSGWL